MTWKKRAAGVYSARPPRRPFASLDAQPHQPPARRARTAYSGPATIEAFTVSYQRDGSPDVAVISALTPAGERALVRTPDQDVIDAALRADPVGWSVSVAGSERLRIEDATPGTLTSGSAR